MSVRAKISALMTLLFAVSILNVFFIFQLDKKADDKFKWVNHTNEVMLETETLLGSLRDAETGQRGYLLTDNPAYLEPYHTAVTDISANLNRLKLLTKDNQEQQQRLIDVGERIELKLAELSKTIELANNGQKSQAMELVNQDKGKFIMDKIRGDMRAFTNTEQVLLEQRKGDYRQTRAEINTLLIVELSGFLGLALFTFFFVNNTLFAPLTLLLSSAEKVKEGKRLTYRDMMHTNELNNLMSTFVDMSDQIHQRESELKQQAHHDELTGLRNRTTLKRDLISAISQSGDLKTAVLFADLDKLKTINDTRGHEMGDALIKEAAKRLVASARATDTIYRVGGDEFLMLIRNLKQQSDVELILNNISANLSQPARFNDELMPISMSIGIAFAPDDTNNPSELVSFADSAMYQAKQNQELYRFYDAKTTTEPAKKNLA